MYMSYMPTCYYVLFSSYSMLSRRMYDVVMGMQCLKLNLFYYILETDKHHCCVFKKKPLLLLFPKCGH